MRRRKSTVVLLVVVVLIASPAYDLANWLEQLDLARPARSFEDTFLTGTTLAVLVIVLVLLRYDRPRQWCRRPRRHDLAATASSTL